MKSKKKNACVTHSWCVVSYWICQAVWRQAGRPPWGEGCRPLGHSGRKVRSGQRDLPGTPLPQCCQTPGAKKHTGISHPLTTSLPLRQWETIVRLWRHSNALRHAHLAIYMSCTLWGVLCKSVQSHCGGNTLMRMFKLHTQSLLSFVLSCISTSCTLTYTKHLSKKCTLLTKYFK